MANTATNVSVGKPKKAGAVFYAPLGTTLPTDATTALSGSFTCLGFVSEDGFTNSDSRESEDIKEWGGTTVLSEQTDKTDKFKLKLIESLNVDVLKAIYGSANVSGTLATGIAVKVNADEVESAVWVVDMTLRGGAMKRVVIPNAKLTELGDIIYKRNEPIGYEATLTAQMGSDGDTHKEYIIKTTNGATGATT